MNPDDGHEEDSAPYLDRLPPGAEQAIDQETIRTALVITRRVHRANPTLSPAINPQSGEIWRLSDEIKRLEENILTKSMDW